MENRVVVTGIGVLAANGNNLDAFWSSLLDARSGIAPITLFKTEGFPVHAAGEVKGFRLRDFVNGRVKGARLSRHTRFALAAAKMAVEHAGLTPDDLRASGPLPLAIGVSTSAMEVIERNEDALVARGPARVSPFGVTSCQPHAAACAIAEYFGVPTRRITLSSACPAGLDAMAVCARMIASGNAGLAVAGGADAPITPLSMASFALGGLAYDIPLSPQRASRPFDLHRQGGLIAEGAGVIVMESLRHALDRGAVPMLEILGYGNTADDPGAESASGLASAMSEALANAGRIPGDIDYVCAHGPSHPVIDRVETAMLKKVLGRHAYRIPVSSIKGVTGNPLAAAGPLQLAACAMSMATGRVPPTANYETPDPSCDLDYVGGRPYRMEIRRALLNVHGLGGGNGAMLVARVASA